MAIKWKNNKKNEKETIVENVIKETKTGEEKSKDKSQNKSWLGILLVAILILSVSAASLKGSFVIAENQKKAIEEYEKEKEKEREQTKIELDYLNDEEKMCLVANMHYLNYKMQHTWEGTTAVQYLLQNNEDYRQANDVLKKEYEEKAEWFMNVLYSVYRMDYEVQGNNTNTYVEDVSMGTWAGKVELSEVIDGEEKIEELQEKYESILIIHYDENGKISLKSYGMEAGNFESYLNRIRIQAIVEYYESQDMPIQSIISLVESEENTYYYDEELGARADIPEEEIQNTYYDEELGGYISSQSEETMEVEDSEEMAAESYEDTGFEEMTTEEVYEAQENEGQMPGTDTNEAASYVAENHEDIEITFPTIKNTNVVMAFTPVITETESYYYAGESWDMSLLMLMFMTAILFVAALVLQNVKALGLKKWFIFNMPTELVAFAGMFALVALAETELFYVLAIKLEGTVAYYLGEFHIENTQTRYMFCVMFWAVFYTFIYWLIANVVPYILHPFRNLKEKSVIIRTVLWIKKKCKKAFIYLTTIKAEKGLKNNVLKIVLINCALMSIFCIGWFAGIVGTIIYSIILYVLLLKKGSKVSEQYNTLLAMTKNMAAGELNTEIQEDLGVFEPVKQELSKIRQGFRHAVEEEVKSQNMKTELITNVSHDLKTPLTAIITYVDLLKDESISEETRREYIKTLEQKSARLKVLIEDLFEVSKASSHNITLHYADVDFTNLIKQVRLENEERIMNSDVTFRWNLPEEKCMVRLDPQKTYRIIENLLVNALKYSMSGSRVYVELTQNEMEIAFTMKNISATELNFEPEKLTERFVRGDESRNTEGSGLGLAIVQSFTEVQGGSFKIEIDGDLFKTTVIFNKEAAKESE